MEIICRFYSIMLRTEIDLKLIYNIDFLYIDISLLIYEKMESIIQLLEFSDSEFFYGMWWHILNVFFLKMSYINFSICFITYTKIMLTLFGIQRGYYTRIQPTPISWIMNVCDNFYFATSKSNTLFGFIY